MAHVAEHNRAGKKFRGLLEILGDAIVGVDSEGRLVLVNAQTEKQFGYTRDELLGQPIEILLPEQFRKAHVSHRAGYFSAPRIRPMGTGLDLLAQRKDGSKFPVDVILSPLKTEEGLLTISVVRDITERKCAEKVQSALFRISEATNLSSDLGELLQTTTPITASGVLSGTPSQMAEVVPTSSTSPFSLSCLCSFSSSRSGCAVLRT